MQFNLCLMQGVKYLGYFLLRIIEFWDMTETGIGNLRVLGHTNRNSGQ